jgi:hypothetical protein
MKKWAVWLLLLPLVGLYTIFLLKMAFTLRCGLVMLARKDAGKDELLTIKASNQLMNHTEADFEDGLKAGIGLVFFAYSANQNDTLQMVERASASAHTYRQHNERIPTALFVSSRVGQKDVMDVFDHVICIPKGMLEIGEYGWGVRTMALALTPFYITLAVDSDTFCCDNLDMFFKEFQDHRLDFAVGSHSASSSR